MESHWGRVPVPCPGSAAQDSQALLCWGVTLVPKPRRGTQSSQGGTQGMLVRGDPTSARDTEGGNPARYPVCGSGGVTRWCPGRGDPLWWPPGPGDPPSAHRACPARSSGGDGQAQRHWPWRQQQVQGRWSRSGPARRNLTGGAGHARPRGPPPSQQEGLGRPRREWDAPGNGARGGRVGN